MKCRQKAYIYFVSYLIYYPYYTNNYTNKRDCKKGQMENTVRIEIHMGKGKLWDPNLFFKCYWASKSSNITVHVNLRVAT